jgi:hypothetical protein
MPGEPSKNSAGGDWTVNPAAASPCKGNTDGDNCISPLDSFASHA